MILNVDPQLSQWDVGRSVSVTDSTATHIHFANQGDSKAVIIEIINGEAKIPDFLLQTGKTLIAYAVLNGVTLESKSFPVRKRERPENYVYEDDQRNYIYELISDAEGAVANANQAAELANEAADKALKAASSWVMIGDASGENIAVNDAVEQSFAGFRIFGKTTQAGVPTPDAPVELVSVGDSGSIAVNVTGKNDANGMSVATPNGLPGIPVASGGNYTDANGQQWICDEIDFARGVYVQRIGRHILNESGYWRDGTLTSGSHFIYLNDSAVNLSRGSLCTHATYSLTDTWGVGRYTIAGKGYFQVVTDLALDDWLHNLAEQRNNGTPITLYHVLIDTIETPLSEEELATYASLHTYRNQTTVSNDASAHMEIEYVMDAKKYIDNLVISGGGSVARLTSITLLASSWTGSNSLYSQVVSIPGITEYSKVDLLPSVEQLAIFHEKDVAFVTENEDGVVTVYAIGDKPLLDYTMQAQITEVLV